MDGLISESRGIVCSLIKITITVIVIDNFNETIRVGGFREAAIAIIIKADAVAVACHSCGM